VTMPFFFLMCAMVLMLWFVPGLAVWLPSKM
jgi:C4-dicarboxylate transporter, DctM subunit